MISNKLYYGDNLGVLREHVPSESVDLVYLDPPFNSNATYNVLFKAPDGVQSQAQIEAFDDTWHWTESAENAYWKVLHGQNTDAARMLEAMRGFLGENDMMAIRHDGHPPHRIAPRVKADRQPLFALRPDRQPLSEAVAGCDFWGGKFQK